MQMPYGQYGMDATRSMAERNRQILREADVLAVNILGSAGAGKTSLIDTSMRRLADEVYIGVIASDPATYNDANRLAGASEQVVQVNTGLGRQLAAYHINEALAELDLDCLGLLFIENVSTLVGAAQTDLGEDLKISVFSLTDGDDKVEKYADLVRLSHAIVLNKIDLLPFLNFDLDRFKNSVRKINPEAEIFELSALSHRGLDPWLDLLRNRILKSRDHVSRWFG